MSPILTGILLGLACVGIVSLIGIKLVSPETPRGDFPMFAYAWRWLLRSGLGIASIVCTLLGFAFTATGKGPEWTMFLSWAASYYVGIFLYFFVRYGVVRK
jgi:hypothetical protein